jgi:uncharacterized protein (UPF0333 family)
MTLKTEEKAQGALEYLILLAGAIFVAAAVGLYLKSIPGEIEPKFDEARTDVMEGF